jgi:hypothetical protein
MSIQNRWVFFGAYLLLRQFGIGSSSPKFSALQTAIPHCTGLSARKMTLCRKATECEFVLQSDRNIVNRILRPLFCPWCGLSNGVEDGRRSLAGCRRVRHSGPLASDTFGSHPLPLLAIHPCSRTRVTVDQNDRKSENENKQKRQKI